MKRLLTALVIIGSFHSCKDDNELTENDKKKISADVIKTLHRYHEDINKSGLTAEIKYFDNSPNFFWVPPGYGSPINYDSVVNILTLNAPAFKSVNNSFVTLKVFPLTRNYITYTATIQSHLSDTMGMNPNNLLLETGVMIKRPDGWKLLNGQTAVVGER
jgi:hypothetical protein